MRNKILRTLVSACAKLYVVQKRDVFMKIGFIGAGNMASAIIEGAVRSGAFQAADICAYDVNLQKAEMLKQTLGIGTAETCAELIAFADAVVLAVKPNVFPTLLPSVGADLQKKDPLVISIAAGKTIY